MMELTELRAKRDRLLPVRADTPMAPAPLVPAIPGLGKPDIPSNQAGYDPEIPKKPPMGEVGAPGTEVHIVGGNLVVTEQDYNPEMRGKAFFEQIDRMRLSDPQVKATMSILKLPIQAADWKMEPASDASTDRAIADWIGDRLFNKMSRTWNFTLRHGLLSLDFGSMPMETVWDIADDPIENRPMYYLKKLGPRFPKTVLYWVVDDVGELQKIVRCGPTSDVHS